MHYVGNTKTFTALPPCSNRAFMVASHQEFPPKLHPTDTNLRTSLHLLPPPASRPTPLCPLRRPTALFDHLWDHVRTNIEIARGR